jgi:hypothetical protein
MKHFRMIFYILSVSLLSACSSHESPQPLSLHPKNPHYFLFRGKPVILIGSTEHYGAVMNLDFDYLTYLNEVEASGLNLTRTFSGAYLEPVGAFGIKNNTLAPAPEKYLCPWLRSKEPGYINGGNKFDLSEWDEAYFSRLKNFVAEAGKRNIVVELDLFSNYYDTIQWKLSPLNILNNINRIGDFKDHKEVLSLKHTDLLNVQELMVRKIVHELKDFDNLYYEVCNEPYFGDTLALREWEGHMTEVVTEAEKDFPHRHLISNNIANNHKLVSIPRNGVSVYNFHYARPPLAVDMNYHLNSVIGDNETGFDGIEDSKYRTEAWNFILAGGGLFDHLDYSFTADTENGSGTIDAGQPGGGGKSLRSQFRILSEFMRSLDYVNMKPMDSSKIRFVDKYSETVRGLVHSDNLIAIYLHRNDNLSAASVLDVELPAASYNIIFTDTKNGKQTVTSMSTKNKDWIRITTPQYTGDLAMKIIETD